MRTLFNFTQRVIIGMVLLLALTTTASAQKITGVKKIADHTSVITMQSTAEGTSVTFTGHTGFAGVINGSLNSATIKFYCIDINHGVNPSAHPEYWDEGSTPEKLTYILNNYYPAKTSYTGKLSDNQEAAAVQVAIWHYSDGADATTLTDATIKTRTLQIIADADANAGNSNPLQTLQIVPATQSVPQGGTASFIVKAVSDTNTPINGLTISLTKTGGSLSTTTATTNANGETGTITLTNGTNVGSVVVTAKANVSIPQGTIYVAKVDPTDHQRLVLASPTTDTKEISTTIVFSAKPSTCDLTKFTTFTQGGWGSPSNSTPGGILDSYFATVFPSGLTIGGNHSIKLTTAAAVRAFLPQGGTAAVLTTNYVNPTSQINVLTGQIAALSLNVAFSNAGYLGETTYQFGALYIKSGVFAGKTVSQFLTIANNALGGANTGYSIADINTAATALNENFDNGTVDKGYVLCNNVCVNQLGGYLYRDLNFNGTKDSGENAIANIVVELVSGSTVVSTSTTDANGKFSFANVSNATYTVRVAASNFASGGVLYSTDQTKWYSKNDVKSASVVVNCADNLAINFGFWKTCVSVTKTADKAAYNIGEKVQYTIIVENCGDVQLHGGVDVFDALLWGTTAYHIDIIDPGKTFTIPAEKTAYTVKSSDCGTLTNTVRAEGHPVDGSATINGTALVNVTINCKASLGDKVWIDTNKNGIQDNGEVGKQGVTVKLFTCANALVTTTTTNANGNYLFENLAPGDYYVQFVLPANYVFTTANAGADDVDSDANVTTGKADCTTLVAGESDITWDAGIYEQVGSIGDKVWEDTNQNGIQDNNENGIPGVTVKLYNCGGTTPIATTTTDGAGLYLFSGLAAGSYFVEFVKPVGYIPTSKDAGSNDAVDSDADATTGKTICADLISGENDLTWDAGFYKEVDKADLKIEKSASKTTANCGDVFDYSIKVTNLGPKTASSVVVNDVLPAGLIYQSSSASVGSYNNTTGVWTIGNLADAAVATLTITIKVDCGSTSSAVDLGPASDFNLFVIEDLTQPSSDTQGKIAVGHNAILSGYSVGDQLPANSGNVLVVGNNLNFTNGDVFNGNVVYGNATNLPTNSVTIAGTLSQGTPINFAVAKAILEGISVTLSNYAVNGTTTFEWGGLKLKGTNTLLNVFKVNGSDLSNANDVQIDVPSGSIALININGTNLSWSGGLEVYGTASTNVLFNFYQATNITLANIDVRGSILAPFAALNYNSGVVNGQVVVKSMTGNGQFNLSLFLGRIPSGKVITNVATVSSPTQDDVLSNNTASAAVTVNPSNNTTPVQGEASLPKEFKLAQNYPNPFNPSTMIEFSVPNAGSYSLKVYDVIGQEVATLVDRDMNAGTHRVTFDASKLSSGMYIYRLVGNNVNITKKMLLTK